MGNARWVLCAAAALVLAPRLARADKLAGFSGVDRPYLVNQDRVCTPLAVRAGAATGAPRCTRAAADAIAQLSIKPATVQSGARAAYTAQADGRTLTVARKGGATLVTWEAPDPITRIVEVYASEYEDRIAVAYGVRKLGAEATELVGFDLGQGQTAVVDPAPVGKDPTGKDPTGKDPTGKDPTGKDPAAATTPQPTDPKLLRALTVARAAGRAAAPAAWRAVLAIDPACAEGLVRSAGAAAVAGRSAEALEALAGLTRSERADAIEWQIEARFDPAFAALRADPAFRAAVGLDRPATTPYEKLMGLGGRWEQSGTSCERPEVQLTAARDRKLRLRVRTRCEGAVADTTFKGTWRVDGERVVLVLPPPGQRPTPRDEAGCAFERHGDEDGLRCALGRDLDFLVLPTRR